MDSITSDRIRPLALEDLGISPHIAETEGAPAEPQAEILPADDRILNEVQAALDIGFSGVILSGPPGTGKSWYARRIAQTLAGEPDALCIVQFHASYQYEDFIEGFVPKEGGGFESRRKVFAQLCDDAAERPDVTHVLLIDEISRCDVARVFGEALTYLETDKRGIECTLASGNTLMVPKNLIVLATMNPWDKGVDELDIALERRFAEISMPPSSDALRSILAQKKADEEFVTRIVAFFESIQSMDDEMVHLGHAYFANCVNADAAKRMWEYRLLPFFRKACRLDKVMLADIVRMWERVLPAPSVEEAKAADAPVRPEPTS